MTHDRPPRMVPARRPIPVNLKRCRAAQMPYRWTPAIEYQYSTLAEKEAFADKMLRRGAGR